MNSKWIEEFNLFISKSCYQCSNIIICGDFNFPKISWDSLELRTGVDEVQFVEQLNDFHLTQLNSSSTRGDHVLDLVITNVPTHVENISVLSLAECGLITDHSTIIFYLKTSVKSGPKLKRTVFDYRRGNFDGLRATLDESDLRSVVESVENVKQGWIKWKELFLEAVYKYIPTKTIKNINSPPWINGEVIHAIQKKETVRRKMKSFPTDALRRKFKELRSRVKHLISDSRARFFETLN